MAGGGGGRSLEQTPTWAVAVVCFVLVAVSIVIEHILHLIGKVLIPYPISPQELIDCFLKNLSQIWFWDFYSGSSQSTKEHFMKHLKRSSQVKKEKSGKGFRFQVFHFYFYSIGGYQWWAWQLILDYDDDRADAVGIYILAPNGGTRSNH